MANWSKSVLTHDGINLINSTISGGNIEITSVKAGSGSVPVVDLRDQTELQSVKQTLQISKLKTVDGITTISAILSNIGLTDSYGLQQIGIYAADGDNEILFAISQADNPTTMPTETETPLYSISFNLSFVISQDLGMTVVIDSESLITLDQLNEVQTNLENEIQSVNGEVENIKNSIGKYIGSKNIISTKNMFFSSGTGTITENSDGSITVKNTSTSTACVKTVYKSLGVNIYTFSVTSSSQNFRWFVGKGDTLYPYVNNSGSYTFDSAYATRKHGIGIEVPASSTMTFYLQGELGDTATDFVKHEDTVAQSFDLTWDITNSLDTRVTTLENVSSSTNTIFNTWTACSVWVKIEYTKLIAKGSVLLFCLHDAGDNTYYNAVLNYYDNDISSIHYVTPTKYIHVEWKVVGYCNVIVYGFTTPGLYKIIQLLK